MVMITNRLAIQNKYKNGLTYWYVGPFLFFSLCYIAEHKDEMADAAGHDEEVEYFVGSEKWEASTEHFKFECVDNTANRIKDAADKEP